VTHYQPTSTLSTDTSVPLSGTGNATPEGAVGNDDYSTWPWEVILATVLGIGAPDRTEVSGQEWLTITQNGQAAPGGAHLIWSAGWDTGKDGTGASSLQVYLNPAVYTTGGPWDRYLNAPPQALAGVSGANYTGLPLDPQTFTEVSNSIALVTGFMASAADQFGTMYNQAASGSEVGFQGNLAHVVTELLGDLRNSMSSMHEQMTVPVNYSTTIADAGNAARQFLTSVQSAYNGWTGVTASSPLGAIVSVLEAIATDDNGTYVISNPQDTTYGDLTVASTWTAVEQAAKTLWTNTLTTGSGGFGGLDPLGRAALADLVSQFTTTGSAVAPVIGPAPPPRTAAPVDSGKGHGNGNGNGNGNGPGPGTFNAFSTHGPGGGGPAGGGNGPITNNVFAVHNPPGGGPPAGAPGPITNAAFATHVPPGGGPVTAAVTHASLGPGPGITNNVANFSVTGPGGPAPGGVGGGPVLVAGAPSAFVTANPGPSQFSTDLTDPAVTDLTPAQVADLTPAELAALPPAQIAALTPAEVAGLSAAQLAALTAAQVAALTPAQVAALTPAEVAELAADGTPVSEAGDEALEEKLGLPGGLSGAIGAIADRGALGQPGGIGPVDAGFTGTIGHPHDALARLEGLQAAVRRHERKGGLLAAQMPLAGFSLGRNPGGAVLPQSSAAALAARPPAVTSSPINSQLTPAGTPASSGVAPGTMAPGGSATLPDGGAAVGDSLAIGPGMNGLNGTGQAAGADGMAGAEEPEMMPPGMGMGGMGMGGMGGAGGRGQAGQERQRKAYLPEEEEYWGTAPGLMNLSLGAGGYDDTDDSTEPEFVVAPSAAVGIGAQPAARPAASAIPDRRTR
jgi:hypothetical protein